MNLNTLEVARRIQAAEREGRAAEEIALVLKELQDSQLDQLVTKDFLHAELEKIRSEIRAVADGLDKKVDLLRSDMEKMELRLTQTLTLRMAAMFATGVAILGGLNIFF